MTIHHTTIHHITIHHTTIHHTTINYITIHHTTIHHITIHHTTIHHTTIHHITKHHTTTHHITIHHTTIHHTTLHHTTIDRSHNNTSNNDICAVANRSAMAACMCTWCCKTHCKAKAAWMLHGAGFGGKPEHETVCFSGESGCSQRWRVPCVCGGSGQDRFEVNRILFGVLQRGDANRIVMAAWMCTCCWKTHCNGCMNVAWGWFWGGSRSTKPCVFWCKVAGAGDEGYLVCAVVAAWIVSRSIGSSLVFCNVGMQIAL